MVLGVLSQAARAGAVQQPVLNVGGLAQAPLRRPGRPTTQPRPEPQVGTHLGPRLHSQDVFVGGRKQDEEQLELPELRGRSQCVFPKARKGRLLTTVPFIQIVAGGRWKEKAAL